MKTNQFVFKLYLIIITFLSLGILVSYKLIEIQFIEGEEYRKIAENKTLRNFKIKPKRGNIYSIDGSILATSVINYDVFFDTKIVNEKIFNNEIKNLSIELSHLTKNNDEDVLKYINDARKKGNRYLSIAKSLSKEQVEKLKTFPIFRLGKSEGGLIVTKQIHREYPLNKIAKRTIGYEKTNHNGFFTGVGLEHGFGFLLRGQDGFEVQKKIHNGQWKSLENELKKEPINGLDVITTLDFEIQDLVHDYLLEQTIKYEADHSSAIVMEVKTGDIKAISNFGITKEGKYYEKLNYAVGESIEPGSTFKLASIAAALENQSIDTLKLIDTGKGEIDFYGYKVRDSRVGGYGKINIMDIIRFSSNTGIVKVIDSIFENNPEKFLDRLFNFGIFSPVQQSIKGEPKPYIPHPNDNSWNGLSLPWMSYGYGLKMTPIQILTFYNAIANNGELVAPKFIHSSKKPGSNQEKIYTKKVINQSIFSVGTNELLKKMLYDVVHHPNGTANNIVSNHVKLAGKTGTTQVDYSSDELNYISSFVGYFPADNPKYSCIVVINKPNKSIGYYGSQVAAPVFKKIAEKIQSKSPEIKLYTKNELYDKLKLTTNLDDKKLIIDNNKIDS
ncbi:MAG: penicillin-binding protein [Flavobacteriaceae bacterium]|nr:penicillin-binding protein [Flavobacteriaceae bacterium]